MPKGNDSILVAYRKAAGTRNTAGSGTLRIIDIKPTPPSDSNVVNSSCNNLC